MKWASRITRIDYDNMEDPGGEPMYKEMIVIIDGEKETRGALVRKWFEKLAPQKMYAGLDGRSYPQFKIDEFILNDSIQD